MPAKWFLEHICLWKNESFLLSIELSLYKLALRPLRIG